MYILKYSDKIIGCSESRDVLEKIILDAYRYKELISNPDKNLFIHNDELKIINRMYNGLKFVMNKNLEQRIIFGGLKILMSKLYEEQKMYIDMEICKQNNISDLSKTLYENKFLGGYKPKLMIQEVQKYH